MEKVSEVTVIGKKANMLDGKKLIVKEKKIILPLLLFVLLGICATNLMAQSKMKHDPAKIKALLIKEILRQIEWPVEVGLNDLSKPFILSVLGNHPFENFLGANYNGKKIKDKLVQVRYIKKVEDIGTTHMLFIEELGRKDLQRVLDYVKDLPILTMGNTEDYAKRGVHVNLLEENKIKMEVNETVARQSGLVFTPNLLKNARIINPYNEYKEKAMKLFDIAESVQWPPESGINRGTGFNISVLGTSPFGTLLSDLSESRKIFNKSVNIRYIRAIDSASGSQLLFITNSKNADLNNILAYVRDKAILTVSDTSGLTREGVHVSFAYDGVKLRPEINPTAAREAGLIIGGDLLKNGLKVRTRSQY